jgi:hypothetical protein
MRYNLFAWLWFAPVYGEVAANLSIINVQLDFDSVRIFANTFQLFRVKFLITKSIIQDFNGSVCMYASSKYSYSLFKKGCPPKP